MYREQGNAIKQERLERIRADLRIATITVNKSGRTRTDRNPPKKGRREQTFLVMRPMTTSHRKASTKPPHAQPICNLRVSCKERKTGYEARADVNLGAGAGCAACGEWSRVRLACSCGFLRMDFRIAVEDTRAVCASATPHNA